MGTKLFYRVIKTEIDIEAPQNRVWEILEDFEGYSNWNPYCIKVQSNKEIGSPFIMTIKMNARSKPFQQAEIFSDYEAPYKVGWKLNWGIFLKTHRIQTLTDQGGGKTYYYTEDAFWGLLSPLVMLLYRADIQKGFEATAEALKKIAES